MLISLQFVAPSFPRRLISLLISQAVTASKHRLACDLRVHANLDCSQINFMKAFGKLVQHLAAVCIDCCFKLLRSAVVAMLDIAFLLTMLLMHNNAQMSMFSRHFSPRYRPPPRPSPGSTPPRSDP